MTDTVIRIPTLTTERLVLRAPHQSDFEAYAAFRASERAEYIGRTDRRAAYLRLGLETALWHLRGYGSWILADRKTDAPLGLAGFYHHADWDAPEIGWALFDGFEGKGLAQEAVRAVINFARSVLGWEEIIASTDTTNTRSLDLARRLGGRPLRTYAREGGTMQVFRFDKEGS